ncbi:monocyte to macrophage differentiation factor 2 isoform X2 [Mesocricetus auratus]|uniref:Monocyte to macrophage differentiation factor 2 isoform X2 n=1 Tax=Mesocricetus auratus TaxID=10036 RepID=A0ABM2XZX0_MESAU|nr:monocyte to macrophage differentiation factor 2 isoform X2 [Mesocricetus auratus]
MVGFWIIPSILGSSNLYFLSDDDWETISAWIYGLGLCGLFVVSTIFHTVSWKKSHLRMVEHCLHMIDRMVIYFFIAASYAPWLNLRELGPWASHMRWLVWVMASVGTIYVFFFHERSHDSHYLLMLLGSIQAKEFHTERVSSHCAGLQHQEVVCSVPPWKLVLRPHDLSPQVQTCGAALLCGDGLFPRPGHPLYAQHRGHLGADDRRGLLLLGHGVLQERWEDSLCPCHLAPLCGIWCWYPLLCHLEVPLPAQHPADQGV